MMVMQMLKSIMRLMLMALLLMMMTVRSMITLMTECNCGPETSPALLACYPRYADYCHRR